MIEVVRQNQVTGHTPEEEEEEDIYAVAGAVVH